MSKQKMQTRNYIVTHTAAGATFCNGFVIADHYSHSYASFGELIAVARLAFPGLLDNEIECRTVVASGWCAKCPVIRFPVRVGSEADGWHQCGRIPDVVVH